MLQDLHKNSASAADFSPALKLAQISCGGASCFKLPELHRIALRCASHRNDRRQ